ncbi:hypothetical protein BVC93_32205 (plasmid) [Mycobacterium sp. MS1601]|nr:hypothetical protein BVC93_32205 [Mycobacterium sp. MS1601]
MQRPRVAARPFARPELQSRRVLASTAGRAGCNKIAPTERFPPRMLGHVVAWLRRFDGGWVAVVEMAVSSSNGRSSVTAT